MIYLILIETGLSSLNSWTSRKVSQSAVVFALIEQVLFAYDSDVRTATKQ